MAAHPTTDASPGQGAPDLARRVVQGLLVGLGACAPAATGSGGVDPAVPAGSGGRAEEIVIVRDAPSRTAEGTAVPRRAAIVDRDRRVDCFGQEADRDAHECKGLNACKGLGGCKTDTNECKGRNECKAMGGCKSAPADCGPGPDAE